MADYNPNSHFFVDHSNLANSLSTNLAQDAYGPVSANLTSKFRTTSFVRASALTKVFAICDGQIMIQPQTGDDTKVNLILKPSVSAIYAPIKIKYFIYRGVRKSDLIGNNILKAINTSDPNQPTFLKKLWKEFVDFNMPFYEQGIIDTPPETFPAFLIGYNETQSADTLIEHYFRRNNDGGNLVFYQIPSCTKGEHIGNFSGRIGLDVVLDYGDYELTNQDELFRLDLGFARKQEHIFDTATIQNTTAIKVKRYKEYIHQFLDAAAFWGSHIECGKIRTVSAPNGITSVSDVFTGILNKYQTKNKIYFYIEAERTRSYNYYDSTRKVHGIDSTPILNDTNGWPIIIKEKTFSATNRILKIALEININTNINPLERRVLVDVIAPNNDTSSVYPIIEMPTGTLGNVGFAFQYDVSELFTDTSITHYSIETGNTLPTGLNLPVNTSVILGTPQSPGNQTTGIRAYIPSGQYYAKELNFIINPKVELLPIEFQVNSTKSCSNFILLFANLKQEFPLKDYYNELWPVNLTTSFTLPESSESLLYWLTYDRNRLLNLDDVLECGASIQNKLVFDNGLNPSPIGQNPSRKKRRLYIANIKRNTSHNFEYDNYNVSYSTAGLEKKITERDQYTQKIFNDKSFSFYRGKFTDGSTVKSICLIHEGHFSKKNSYFQLGITEEEYNKLVYDSVTVPPLTPPQTTIPQILPYDAENVFFHLEEDFNFTHQNIRKFKVGLWYEDNTGNTSVPLYPSADVIVYTLDGFTFFSNEFTDYQEFYKEFANAKVEFRTVPNSTINPPIPTYNGEFGFDWLRINDTPMDVRPTYKDSIVSGYERPHGTDLGTEYENKDEAYKALKLEYKSIPTQKENEQYFISYLNLFSESFSNSISYIPNPPFTASLRVYVEIDQDLNKLEFEYDSNLFAIDKLTLSDNLQTAKKESDDKTITITCLRDFSESQQIRVLAYPLGISNKKDAQLAGIIVVNKNDLFTRKEAKIALISVHTDVNNDGTPEEALYMPQEIENLYNILHQNFNYCNIVQGLVLDLKSDTEFKRYTDPITGNLIEGGFIYPNDGVRQYNSNTDEKIHSYLKNAFLNLSGNNIYNAHFLIFAFHLTYQSTNIYGHVDEIGKPLVVVYNIRAMNPPPNDYPPRDLTTLNHEVMHGYGLYHTHKEQYPNNGPFIPITEPEKKYTYPNANDLPSTDKAQATDNVMSYNNNAVTLWQWQRKFIKIK